MRPLSLKTVATSLATLVIAISLATPPVLAAAAKNRRARAVSHVGSSNHACGNHAGAVGAGGWHGGRRHDERFGYGGYRRRYRPSHYGQSNYDQGYDGLSYRPDVGLGIVGGIIGAEAGAIDDGC
jgi:hypothetical protein